MNKKKKQPKKSPHQEYVERIEREGEDPEVVLRRERGRPKKYETPEQLNEAIAHYFDYCHLDNHPYTMSGLAYFLGMSRHALIDYKENNDYLPAIREARHRVEVYGEESLARGVPATGIIFGLKNNFAWKDQTQLDVTTKGERIYDLDQLKEAAKEILSSENE